MTTLPPCYGIIPARYNSSRFPGKPLVEILGKPMFQWVYERSCQCAQLSKVWLATDDDRILAAAHRHGVPAVMTDADHPSGSDRIMEAADRLGLEEEAVIVNIQGDEPALDARMLRQLVEPFAEPAVQATTLARKIDAKEAENTDRVKVVRARDGRALYFSRSKIPHLRDEEHSDVPYLLHIGLYAYRLPVLKTFTSLPTSPLEEIEKLEQLRLLEANIDIQVVLTDYEGFGVDRPEDVQLIVQRMQPSRDQR